MRHNEWRNSCPGQGWSRVKFSRIQIYFSMIRKNRQFPSTFGLEFVIPGVRKTFQLSILTNTFKHPFFLLHLIDKGGSGEGLI